MPVPRNRTLGKPKYYHGDINVSLDESAQIYKIPASKSWYFKMWIPEEKRQLRTSLRTGNLEIIGLHYMSVKKEDGHHFKK